MSTLKYFMWPWQEMFQASAAFIAKRILDLLDPQLAADAFLVGFRIDDAAPGQEPIGVSPDDCRFSPSVFKDVPRLAEQFAADDPRSTWRCSAPSEPGLYEQIALRDGGRRAVEHVLSGADGRHAFFASHATPINGYAVFVVVQVDRTQYESHYRLKSDFVQKVQLRYSVGRSLIDTTIRAYLDALAEKLQRPNAGENPRLIDDYGSIYRAAAEQLMRAPAWAGGDLMGLGNIYDICNTISLQNYEGTEGAGRLTFVRKDHPAIKIDLKLRNPVSIHSVGAVRKLLQMGSGSLSLFCDSRDVYGLGTVGAYDEAGEDLFVVRFLKRFTWELCHAGHVLMHCREGRPQLRPPGPSAEPIREALLLVFPERKIDHLADLAMVVAAQTHGTILVITPSADAEAVRLANQATVVEPFPLTAELIPLLTSIDGAVLIDLDGTCHAIGVILDGLASDKCTPARGSRYSGVRYAYQPDKSDRVVLVKSEDGMVNVLPEADQRRPSTT